MPYYNFNNIIAEFRDGSEYQNPLSFFPRTFVEKDYSEDLLGPLVYGYQIERIFENDSILKSTRSFANAGSRGGYLDGSEDSNRVNAGNYTSWNKVVQNLPKRDQPKGVTHIINNPNTTSFFVTLLLKNISDTSTRTIEFPKIKDPSGKDVPNPDNLSPGTKFPAPVRFQIEYGYIDPYGAKEVFATRNYLIVALVQTPALIDIGNTDFHSIYTSQDFAFLRKENDARFLSGTDLNTHFTFNLPSISSKASSENWKRYVTVKKLSAETTSTLITKAISLVKVTEVMEINLSYPFSALVGLKLDAKNFSSIPKREYDVKMKKVRVPSNYFPIRLDGTDKRYYATETLFNNTTANNKLLYNGNWNGKFKNNLEWTDNPAWILYDMLTDKRYGLGQFIDESKIDKWDLYKISRWCDNVDEDGYFVGVSDGIGGREPRYSCNVLFENPEKLIDAINIVSALFRGTVYYANSEINFNDDRPKTPIALFTNSNVKEGVFTYTNLKRDEQFNVIEAIYLDKNNDFETKIEYAQNEADIRKRGIFKTTMSMIGCTSKSMAQRAAKHILYQTTKENQNVSFSCGLEALLCRPGDLIIIEDDLKSLKNNFGRVLSIDKGNSSLRLQTPFESNEFNGKLTVYTPTGRVTSQDLQNIVDGGTLVANNNIELSSPLQITTFDITGVINKDYGSEVFLDLSDSLKKSLFKLVKEGTPYRFQRNFADDQIYKVMSIVEEDVNLYNIAASKYDTGKYNLIELNQQIETQYSTYPYQTSQTINGVTLTSLDIPQIQFFGTNYDSLGNFVLSGSWSTINGASSYNVQLIHPDGFVDDRNITTANIVYNDVSVGDYLLRVNAKGGIVGGIKRFDSLYDNSGLMVIYETATSSQYSSSFLSSIALK
jgi:hypothetical protein